MNLQPVKSNSLADKIFAQIATEIVSGRYPAGTKLPAERKLSEVFEVNRHVVREALKRLEQVGLVRVSQGGNTEVLDFRRTAGLDVLQVVAKHAMTGSEATHYWRSVLEMRAALAADIARLCALRASPAIKADIKTICQSMRLATDDQALFALEIRFWDALLLGADNLAYRLAFNGMMQSLQLMPEAVQAWGLNEVRKSDCHQALCEAIARGDAEAAELDVKTLMRDGLAAFSKFSERVAETGSTANRA